MNKDPRGMKDVKRWLKLIAIEVGIVIVSIIISDGNNIAMASAIAVGTFSNFYIIFMRKQNTTKEK